MKEDNINNTCFFCKSCFNQKYNLNKHLRENRWKLLKKCQPQFYEFCNNA